VIGVLIALAALIFRMTRGQTQQTVHSRARNDAKPAHNDDGVILEARQTGQGWTVE